MQDREKLTSFLRYWFEAQPSQPAVLCGEDALTFAGLDALSDRAAGWIDAHFSVDEHVVAYSVTRSTELIVLMVGIIKAAKTLLPLGRDDPPSRVRGICERSGVRKIVVDRDERGRVAGVDVEQVPFDIEHQPGPRLHCPVASNDLLYILHTSGSSGAPKGVVIETSAFLHFHDAFTATLPLRPGYKILASTAVSFDVAMVELLVSLLNGMTIVLADDVERRSPAALCALIARHAIDVVQMTPTGTSMLLSHPHGLRTLSAVPTVLVGGEPLPQRLANVLATQTPAAVYNLYGPTEATIWCMAKRLAPDRPVSVGAPLPGNEIRLVRDGQFLTQPGLVGEICIGGRQLAKGYLNDEHATRERFVDPGPCSQVRLYRTGDLGRWLPDGELECVGRSDQQIKFLGHRVELGEIESHLLAYPHITSAAAIVKENVHGIPSLWAYYTSTEELLEGELRRALEAALPNYMVPRRCVRLPEMPLTPSGKIDRRALVPLVGVPAAKRDLGEASADRIADRVVELVVSLLDDADPVAGVDTLQTFRMLGIDSLSFVRLLVSIEQEFGFEFGHEELIVSSFDTVRDLIERVRIRVGEARRDS